MRHHHLPRAVRQVRVLAPLAVDRSPSPPSSWATPRVRTPVHLSDERGRRDGVRQTRV